MATLPSIGVRLHGGVPPKACVDLARVADRSDYASLWFAENAFNRGVLPAVAASIVATEKIRVGIGVFNPYNRHPTLIAMEIGALDELGGGRAALGIGSGIGDRVEKMGLSYDKPLGAVRDAISIVRGMLQGEKLTYSGSVFSVKDAKLEFTPPRPDFPIYMASIGDQSLRICGQIADGLMISNMCPPGFTRRAISLMGEGAGKVGRKAPSTVIQYVQCAARKDRNEARALITNALGRMLAEYWTFAERMPVIRESMVGESGIPEADVAAVVARIKGGEEAARVLDDRFIDAYSISGNIEDCLAGAERFAKAGTTELVLTFVGPQSSEDMKYLGSGLKGLQ